MLILQILFDARSQRRFRFMITILFTGSEKLPFLLSSVQLLAGNLSHCKLHEINCIELYAL